MELYLGMNAELSTNIAEWQSQNGATSWTSTTGGSFYSIHPSSITNHRFVPGSNGGNAQLMTRTPTTRETARRNNRCVQLFHLARCGPPHRPSNRVAPFVHVRVAHDVLDDAKRRLGRVDERVADHELLQDVVLRKRPPPSTSFQAQRIEVNDNTRGSVPGWCH